MQGYKLCCGNTGVSLPKNLYLVSHCVNFSLVTAVTEVREDSPGSTLFGKSSCFLHPLLVDIPQHHYRVKCCKLLSHEATNPTTCSSYQNHLTRDVFFLLGSKEVDERFHIVPQRQQKDLDCFQKEIHDGPREMAEEKHKGTAGEIK